MKTTPLNVRRLGFALSFLTVLSPLSLLAGPFAPATGNEGSTAVHMNTNLIVTWATGWTNYIPGVDEFDPDNPDSWGFDEIWQQPSNALGRAQGSVYDIVCLGGGGQITMTFDPAIADGPGFDFAVFENANSDTNFLELAWVEVSSDGLHFCRFKNRSLTAGIVSVTNSFLMDPTDLDGLAGKYRRGYGTPFDLANLRDTDPLLDVNAIRYVRVIDIMGDGSALDSEGSSIYDPYPTTGSPGFDLDAIGVMNYAMDINMQTASTGFSFSWQTVSDQVYRVEYIDKLGTENWTDTGLAITGNNERATLSITNILSPQGFFRFLQSPGGSVP